MLFQTKRDIKIMERYKEKNCEHINLYTLVSAVNLSEWQDIYQ